MLTNDEHNFISANNLKISIRENSILKKSNSRMSEADKSD